MKAALSDILKFRSMFIYPLLGVLVIVGLAISNQLFSFQNLLNALETATYDLRIRLLDRQPSEDIVIVIFDETSDQALRQELGGWPYPRYVYADIIDFLNQGGARSVGVDLMFIDRISGEGKSDQRLVQSFVNSDNVVFALTFSNTLERDRQYGITLEPQEVQQAFRLALPLENRLDPFNINIEADETGFFKNTNMTFNTFRPLMPELMAVGDRIGFINQTAGDDGITRGSQMVLRFVEKIPYRTEHPPVTQVPGTEKWQDAEGWLTDQNGVLLDETGNQLTKPIYRYFPHLALEVFLKTRFPDKEPAMVISPEGQLQFDNYKVPLSRNGDFLINWYNRNFYREMQKIQIGQLEMQKQQLIAASDLPALVRQQKSAQLNSELERLYIQRDKGNLVSPYPVFLAAQVLQAAKRIQQGQGTPADHEFQSFFKDKVVFIGTTTVGSYDIKNTPMGRMAGVMVQASIFDNLYQNRGYIHKPSPLIELITLVLLCSAVGLVTMKAQKTFVEIMGALVIIFAYAIVALILFKYQALWLNMALPVVLMGFIAALILVTKYIRRTQEYQQAYAMANTDSMTGLFNHRYFKAKTYECMTQSDIMRYPFSLILVDVDHFKKFNDTYGHQAGDEVLRCVARKLKESVRAADMVARYGGEEMAIILQSANQETAFKIAENVVKAVASQSYAIPGGLEVPVTISAGVATYPLHGETLEELVEFADQGLYRAKEGGRNQVGSLPSAPESA